MKKLHAEVRKVLFETLIKKNKLGMEENKIEIFSYDEKNFNTEIVNKSEDSLLDTTLKEKWNKIEKNSVLRYPVKSQQSKILDGKYRFYAQVKIAPILFLNSIAIFNKIFFISNSLFVVHCCDYCTHFS